MGVGEAEATGLERADLRPPGYICDECLRNNCSVANIPVGVGVHERPKCSKFLPTTHSRSCLWGLVSFWWWHWLSRFELRRPVLPCLARLDHMNCRIAIDRTKRTEPTHETDNPLHADELNFYKIEKWTKDGSKVDSLLYAGSNLDKARKIFIEAINHRPRIRLTIRQRTAVLEQWPQPSP